jgi:radical SAM superfamily enzyme YgiQ (UPF0313 family)
MNEASLYTDPTGRTITPNVVLITTYELGRQSFGVASAAAWLERAGATVSVQDLSVADFDPEPIRDAQMVAFYVPMHTATRLAEQVVTSVREINDAAVICVFGLYAPINERHLRDLGADFVLGGEVETDLVSIYTRAVGNSLAGVGQVEPTISLRRQRFIAPDRSGFPALDKYAKLQITPEVSRVVGYTEASRGCKHLCRHCPVVPVYNGTFVVVQPDVVLDDIRNQARAGAQHITFGDPDFFNGPKHAVRVVTRMHEEFPDLTYDVTIKVEHLRKHSRLLGDLASTGCVLVTTAVESFDDEILERFDKRHTRDDLEAVIGALRDAGIALNPTFVTFTPWTTLEGYVEFLRTLADLDLVDNMSAVQYAIRLLIPSGSKLLELAEVRDLVGPFDDRELVYPWRHPEPAVDILFDRIVWIVEQGQANGLTRVEIFNEVWSATNEAAGIETRPLVDAFTDDVPDRVTVPYLTEPWYC